jgi:hypothetical protein
MGLCELDGEVTEESDGNERMCGTEQNRINGSILCRLHPNKFCLVAGLLCHAKGKEILVLWLKQTINKEIENSLS